MQLQWQQHRFQKKITVFALDHLFWPFFNTFFSFFSLFFFSFFLLFLSVCFCFQISLSRNAKMVRIDFWVQCFLMFFIFVALYVHIHAYIIYTILYTGFQPQFSLADKLPTTTQYSYVLTYIIGYYNLSVSVKT